MKYFLTHVLPADAEFAPGLGGRLSAHLTDLDERGIELTGSALRSDVTPTLVRRTATGTMVSDGPFAETKELVAGYDLIEAADLDEAIAVASAHPTVEAGAIEIRPVAPGMPTPLEPDMAAGRERYLMLVCWDQTGDAEIRAEDMPIDDASDPMAGWLASTGERRLHGWQLQPPALATTVRRGPAGVVVTDGPFAETKEQIGGYDILDVADLAEAVSIAEGHGAALLDLRLCSDMAEIFADV